MSRQPSRQLQQPRDLSGCFLTVQGIRILILYNSSSLLYHNHFCFLEIPIATPVYTTRDPTTDSPSHILAHAIHKAIVTIHNDFV